MLIKPMMTLIGVRIL